jgi:hypothetical protein
MLALPGLLLALLPARTQLIHLSAVDVLIIAVYFTMVLFIGFYVKSGTRTSKAQRAQTGRAGHGRHCAAKEGQMPLVPGTHILGRRGRGRFCGSEYCALVAEPSTQALW